MVDVVVVGSGPNGLAAAITCAAGRALGRSSSRAPTRSAAAPAARRSRCPASCTTSARAVHPLAAVSPVLPGRRPGPARPRARAAGGRARPPARRRPRRRAPPVASTPPPTGSGVDGARVAAPRRLGRPRAGTTSPRPCSPRCSACPAIPLTMAGFGAARCPPGHPRRAAPSPPTRRVACFAGAAAHSFLPLSRPFTVGHGPDAPRVRSRGGVAQRSRRVPGHRRRHGQAPRRAGRHDRDRPRRCTRSTTSPTRAPCSSTSRRGSSLRICGDALPDRYRTAPRSLPLRPWRLQDRLRPVRAGPVDEPRRPPRRLPAPRRHPPRGRRRRRPTSRPGATRPARSCWSRSRASSTPDRAPAGQHTLWTYCHVPARSTLDMTERHRGADRAVRPWVPRRRPGPPHRRQQLVRGLQPEPHRRRHRRRLARRAPAPAAAPSRSCPPTPRRTHGLFLCSASTPPGGGVHGMCGHNAAQVALAGPLR